MHTAARIDARNQPLPRRGRAAGSQATAALLLASVAGGLAPIVDFLQARGFLPAIPFFGVTLCLPAVACSVPCWSARLASVPKTILAASLLMLAGVAWVDETEAGRGAVIAVSLAIAIPTGMLIRQRDACRFFAKVFMAASALHLAVALAHSHGDVGRLGMINLAEHGQVGNPNVFGGQMAISAILAVLLFLNPGADRSGARRARPAASMFWMAVAFVFYAAVLMSASRGASICLGGATILILVNGRMTTAKLMLCCAIVAAGLYLLAADSFILASARTRFQDGEELGSFGERLPIWEAAYMSIWEHPRVVWFGFGTGGVDKILATYTFLHSVMGEDGVPRRAVHNTYIEWVLSYGMLGLMLGAGLLVALVRRARWLDRQGHVCERSAILAYCLLFSMSTCVYRLLYFGPVAALMIALLMGATLAPPHKAPPRRLAKQPPHPVQPSRPTRPRRAAPGAVPS